MSKASEWAKRRAEAQGIAERPSPLFVLRHGECFVVDRDGDLLMTMHDQRVTWFSPAKALELARWILDTFGEDTRA